MIAEYSIEVLGGLFTLLMFVLLVRAVTEAQSGKRNRGGGMQLPPIHKTVRRMSK